MNLFEFINKINDCQIIGMKKVQLLSVQTIGHNPELNKPNIGLNYIPNWGLETELVSAEN